MDRPVLLQIECGRESAVIDERQAHELALPISDAHHLATVHHYFYRLGVPGEPMARILRVPGALIEDLKLLHRWARR